MSACDSGDVRVFGVNKRPSEPCLLAGPAGLLCTRASHCSLRAPGMLGSHSGSGGGLLRKVYDALGDKRDLSSFIISNYLPAQNDHPTLPVTEGDGISWVIVLFCSPLEMLKSVPS